MPAGQRGRGEGSDWDKTHRRREPDSVGAFYFKAAGCWVVGFSFPLSTQLNETLQHRDQPFLVCQRGSATGPSRAGLPAASSHGSGLLRALHPGGHASRLVCVLSAGWCGQHTGETERRSYGPAE